MREVSLALGATSKGNGSAVSGLPLKCRSQSFTRNCSRLRRHPSFRVPCGFGGIYRFVRTMRRMSICAHLGSPKFRARFTCCAVYCSLLAALAGCLKCVQFYNWFRLQLGLSQFQNILGGATHNVSTVTEKAYE